MFQITDKKHDKKIHNAVGLILAIAMWIWAFLCICPASFGDSALINAFNSGELSPLLEGRTDITRYYRGCRTLENMLVMAQGGATKRPGTYYVADAKFRHNACRMISFEYSTTQAYAIEAGNLYARFYMDGGQIVQDDNSVYELTTTYTGDDLFELQYVQSADKMYIAHNDYPPRELTRTDHNAWTITDLDFEGGPFLPENDTITLTITPSGTGETDSYDYYFGGDNYFGAATQDEDWHAQTFTATEGYSAVGVILKISRAYSEEGGPGPVTVSLRAVSSDKPTGADLAIGTTDGNTLPLTGSGQWRQITFASPYTLTATTEYAIVVRALSAGDDQIYWRGDIDGGFTGGVYSTSLDNDSTWTAYPTGLDKMFEIVPASGEESDTITLEASGDIFNSNHVGALWQISHVVESVSDDGSFSVDDEDSTGTEVFIRAGREYDFSTHGKWTGTIGLQRSYDEGTTWEDILSYYYRNDGNVQYSDTEQFSNALYRVKWTKAAVSAGDTCNYNLTARTYLNQGIVEITEVNDVNTATAVVETDYPLGGTDATYRWAEGAWSDDEGYPACIAFYEERLCFAATKNKPDTLWMSQTGDWPNFRAGSLDTDAVSFTLASDTVDAIRWMVPQAALLIGTTGGEWVLSGSGIDEALSANNPPRTRKQSSHGSAQIQALAMNNQTLFVQRQDQKIRKFQYSFNQDNWEALDLTLLAEHITGDGITNIAFQKNPYPILWCVREDGQLISLTLEDSHEVIGWARHITTTGAGDSIFESVAVIPGDGEDEVWVSVYRSIADNDERYIEQLAVQDWGDDQNDIYFVDCGTSNAGQYDVVGPTAGYTQISTPQELQNINDDLDAQYEIINDIDMQGFAFTMLGNKDEAEEFTGVLDGRGFTVSNLTISSTISDDNVYCGMFGQITGDGTGDAGVVKNLHLENVYIKQGTTATQQTAGALVAWATAAEITHVSATGRIVGPTWSGSTDMTRYTNAGGLIGTGGSSMNVDKCWADVDIEIYRYGKACGGFIGNQGVYTGDYNDCYAHGDMIEGPNYSSAYQGGSITGIGGFHGAGIGSYTNCYSTGYIIEGYRYGDNKMSGGFVGNRLGGSFTSCYYDADTSNCGAEGDPAEVAGYDVNGLSTAEAMLEVFYTNWDFNDVWFMSTYPDLYPYVDEDTVPRVTSIVWDGLDHLEGETVDVVTDGAYYGSQTVVAGTITLDSTDYNNITVGLPYTGKLEPMKLEIVGSPGALFGEIKRIDHLYARFYKTVGCDAGPSFTDYDPMIFNNDPNNALVYSGDIDFEFDGDYEREGDICLAEDEPYPFTVLALKAIYEASD